MKLMSVGVWVSDSLVRLYKSWFKAVFFFSRLPVYKVE